MIIDQVLSIQSTLPIVTMVKKKKNTVDVIESINADTQFIV